MTLSMADDRCPFLPTSRQYWTWMDRYEKALADLGVAEDEVMTGREVFDWAGMSNGSNRSIRDMIRHHPNPPEPAFRVVRLAFYLRSEIEVWLGPNLETRSARRARAEEVRQAKEERAVRWADRASPVRATSGFRGVRKQPTGATWNAYLYLDRTTGEVNVGNYRTAEEAALAVDKARMLYGYPPINLPDRVNEHDRVEIFARKRSTEGSEWLVEMLVRYGRSTTHDLWRLNQGARASQRFKTPESLGVGLYRLVRLGRARRVAPATFEAA